jgi:hypothetical protein
MVPLLAQKAGLDDKVEVFVLYVDPITITDMIDRSLKADAHKKHLHGCAGWQSDCCCVQSQTLAGDEGNFDS